MTLSKMVAQEMLSSSEALFIAGTEFEKIWRGLKGDVKSQAAYLQLLDPSKLPSLFKTSLTGSLLASIVTAALHSVVSQSCVTLATTQQSCLSLRWHFAEMRCCLLRM